MLVVARNSINIALFSLFLLNSSISAETLRVTTWNLQGANSLPSNGILTNSIEAAAAALKQLDPDVILLQQVRDWRMCSQLAQSLKPAVYEVLICSAFPETSLTGKENRQAAILSKRKAYFSWSESWAGSNDNQLSYGVVFAAIQTAEHRVCLFSVELDNSNLPNTQQKWTQQIQSIRKWVTNRPELAVVAAGLSDKTAPTKMSASTTEKDRVVHDFIAAPLAANRLQTSDMFLSQLTAKPDAFPALVLNRFPQTCDLDLELAKPTATSAPETSSEPANVAARVTSQQTTNTPVLGLQEATSEAGTTELSEQDHSHGQILWLALTPLAIASFGILLWVLARQGNTPQREVHSNFPLSLEAGSMANSDSVLITSPSTTGSTSEESVAPSIAQPVIQQLQVWQQRALAAEQKAQQANDVIRNGLMAYMREWLKQKLFRKLIADRAQLLESQHVATLKALAVDERLSRLETQIQQQNKLYEHRIEELTQELAITKEESRALIRAQIMQIKSEMEAARARLIAEAGRDRAVG